MADCSTIVGQAPTDNASFRRRFGAAMKIGITISSLFIGFSMYYFGMPIQDSQAAVSEVKGYVFQTYIGDKLPTKAKSAPRSFAKPPSIGTSAALPYNLHLWLLCVLCLSPHYIDFCYMSCLPQSTQY